MTIRQLFREFVMARRREKRDQERHLSLLWVAADLNARASVGKLPTLKEFLRKSKGFEPQTRREQQSVIAQMSAQLGIPLQKTRLIRKVS